MSYDCSQEIHDLEEAIQKCKLAKMCQIRDIRAQVCDIPDNPCQVLVL